MSDCQFCDRTLHWIEIAGVVVVTLRQCGHRFEFRIHPGGDNLVRLNQVLIANVNDPDLPFDEMDADSVLRAVLQLQGVMP